MVILVDNISVSDRDHL